MTAGGSAHSGRLVELTVNEFRRLFAALLLGAQPAIRRLFAWSARAPPDITPEPETATSRQRDNNDRDSRLEH